MTITDYTCYIRIEHTKTILLLEVWHSLRISARYLILSCITFLIMKKILIILLILASSCTVTKQATETHYYLVGFYVDFDSDSTANGLDCISTTNPLIPNKDSIVKWIKCSHEWDYNLTITCIYEFRDKRNIDNFLGENYNINSTSLNECK
jgi:hypothetical protein